jgi:hypothetical protein
VDSAAWKLPAEKNGMGTLRHPVLYIYILPRKHAGGNRRAFQRKPSTSRMS